jgi:hypothetical protein
VHLVEKSLTLGIRLELEGYDPRCLIIPFTPGLKSLTITDVQDADDWLEELLSLPKEGESDVVTASRFPNLRYLALPSTSLLNLPALPLAHLAHLDLSGNLLDSLPASLASLHTLVSLNLSANVITSVRNAPQVLGNITTLNLSKNRIDCLIGLERLLGLERLDVRGNEIRESAEIGRLATLPHIREVWCGTNPFEGYEDREIWRTELGVAFVEENQGDEGKNVVLDGQPWSWSERRKIEQTLAAHGRQPGGHNRAPTTPAGSRPPSSYTQVSGYSSVPPVAHSASSTPSKPPIQPKKRRKQRIVNLDGTVARETLPDESGESESEADPAQIGESNVKHSNLRSVLDPFPESAESAPSQAKQSNSPSKRPTDRVKAHRARASAPVYDPVSPGDQTASPASQGTTGASAANGEDFRQQMEALRMEVGESWLKVLARNQAGAVNASEAVPEEEEVSPAPPPTEATEPAVVKVVKKSGRKKSSKKSAS